MFVTYTLLLLLYYYYYYYSMKLGLIESQSLPTDCRAYLSSIEFWNDVWSSRRVDSYKSLTTQILHNAVLAPIPYTG